MECCCCLEDTDHSLTCGHHFCIKCSLKYISTRWHDGNLSMSCPMCRNLLDVKCKMRNNVPIFKYDKEIYFTISASGILQQVESHYWPVGNWLREERQGSLPPRLVRCHEAHVLPLLVVNSVDKRERECQ